ncbi:maleylacetate reductase [Microbacterium album]|uniref:Maleylacetate reductase n=1 Tax=Microbacterium album TaxID=2053191 RepID=A0A917IGM3_9MICO|nr:maleylacetate reductase [Microbacterium album]GGH48503.1 maleylacetate reductase [Microbacterium album]
MGIVFDHSTLGQRVLFGTRAAVDNTAIAVEGLGAARVLLIADAFAIELADAIAARMTVVARIHDIVQHVPSENARAAVELAKETKADAVVAIGGGSATGLAKIVARDTGLPVVAVPTTFAGSEATNVWGITEAEHKTTGVDDRVLPKVVVYDASLSAGLPGRLAVSSGLNAIAHAVDGFWAPRADPINRALGTEGLRALVPGLRALHADPDDLDAREQTLYGAYLAAVAFASAGSGMHHKICHVLGGRFNMPHAETHSVVLGYVLAFNAEDAPDAAARVSAAFDGRPAVEALFEFRGEIGAPASLAELGLREEDISEAAALSVAAIPPSNPRSANVEGVENLLRAAWAGAAP